MSADASVVINPRKLAYTFPEAREATTFSRAFFYKLESQGHIRLIRFGSKTLVPVEAIDAILCGRLDIKDRHRAQHWHSEKPPKACPPTRPTKAPRARSDRRRRVAAVNDIADAGGRSRAPRGPLASPERPRKGRRLTSGRVAVMATPEDGDDSARRWRIAHNGLPYIHAPGMALTLGVYENEPSSDEWFWMLVCWRPFRGLKAGDSRSELMSRDEALADGMQILRQDHRLPRNASRTTSLSNETGCRDERHPSWTTTDDDIRNDRDRRRRQGKGEPEGGGL